MDERELLEEMAFDFLCSHETVFGRTTVSGREVAATALTSDDLVALLRRAYEAGRAGGQ